MSGKDRYEFFAFRLFAGLFNLLGLKLSRKAAGMLAFLFFYFVPVRKDVVLKNLRIAFPEKGEKEIKKIAYQNYKSFLITLAEIMIFPKLPKDKVSALVKFDNLELIKEKLEYNKGLLMLTAHFGNWELGAVSLGIKLDARISVLAKNQRNPLVTEWLNNMREVFGNKVIPLGVSVRNIYKALKEKKIVGVVGDQRGPSDGIRVDFFGQPTSTYPGTASLIHKLGTPVAGAFVARQNDGSYICHVADIELPDDGLAEEDFVREFNSRYMKLLEKYTTIYPEQWFWMHNIWKY